MAALTTMQLLYLSAAWGYTIIKTALTVGAFRQEAAAAKDVIDAENEIIAADAAADAATWADKLSDFTIDAQIVEGRRAAVIGKSGVGFSSTTALQDEEFQNLVRKGWDRISRQEEFASDRFTLIKELQGERREAIDAGLGLNIASSLLGGAGSILTAGMKVEW